jgi:hypothetical protein
MEISRKSPALLLIVAIVLSQWQAAARREGTPDKACELHNEKVPDLSTLDYMHASQTVPSITGAIVADDQMAYPSPPLEDPHKNGWHKSYLPPQSLPCSSTPKGGGAPGQIMMLSLYQLNQWRLQNHEQTTKLCGPTCSHYRTPVFSG